MVNKFYAPQKARHKLAHPFSRRYLIHLIIIIISSFTIASNLNAHETRRDDYNQTSIAGALIYKEDLGLIEVEGPILNSKKITRYLGQTGVAYQNYLNEAPDIEEIVPSTVAGDSAVISPILSPVEEGLRERDKIIYYTVQQGDSISTIASQFGVSNYTLLWENNLTAYSVIRPGDKLAILPTSGLRHKVKKGETISSIAKKYSIDSEKIIEFNKLASVNDIQIGEKLFIPGGQVIQPKKSYTVRSFYQPPAAKVVSSGKMLWPTTCRYISQYYRWGHSAIDLACNFGSAIYSVNGGTVITAKYGWNGGYGNYVIVDHGGGVQTLYAHFTKLYVQSGQTVNKGAVLGLMGSTGRSTGPHLHFEIRVGGVRKNPLYYIK